jgi:hypothetical protein
MIPNPGYVPLPEAPTLGTVVGVGSEDWMVSKNVGFANLYIGTDEHDVKKWNEEHFLPKSWNEAAEKKRGDAEAGDRGEDDGL